MLFGMGLMTYAGLQISDTRQIYRESDIAYENLRSEVKKSPASHKLPREKPPHQMEYAPENTAPELPNPPKTPRFHVPDLDIDFFALRQINKDAAAWLYFPNTAIDYPVMRSNDYNYYLNHLPDGTVNINGSLFIDCNCDSDFGDPLTVIYGHHMKSGDVMFGSLKGYKEQKYYEEHPYMYLYTEQKNYRIELLYGVVIAAGKWREQAFMFSENLEALLGYSAINTTFESKAEYTKGDRIVALSTCSYEFDGARYLVLGILESEY
jgi:sortase B